MHLLEHTSTVDTSYFMPFLKRSEGLRGFFKLNFRGVDRGYVLVFFDNQASNMTFSYQYRGELKRLDIGFERIASNLGRGDLWYFICPLTKKMCRKLYFIAGYFAHRTAFKYAYYENQTMSRRRRERDKEVSKTLRLNKEYEDYMQRPPRMNYGGKLTKRWVKYMAYVRLHCHRANTLLTDFYDE